MGTNSDRRQSRCPITFLQPDFTLLEDQLLEDILFRWKLFSSCGVLAMQSGMLIGQLCAHGVHGGAGDLKCLTNMKRHLPYVGTDIVMQLCPSCWLTLSTGKLIWVLLTKTSSGLWSFTDLKVKLKFALFRLGLLWRFPGPSLGGIRPTELHWQKCLIEIQIAVLFQ